MKKSKNPKVDAVVVLSGGQDSAICLALACRKYGSNRVAAITFEYGQRHSAETKYARGLAQHFGIGIHKIVKLPFYAEITDNALMDAGRTITRSRGASAPNTLVDGRNAFFLLIAGVWAKSMGATKIYTGVSQADYSGYPDCRAKFIISQQQTMRLAMEWPFEIVAPFMNMTKAQEWELADKLGIFELISEKTLTCYRGIPGRGCGRCPACKLRNAGLRQFLSKAKGKR